MQRYFKLEVGLRGGLIWAMAAMLAACGGPADKTLATGATKDQFQSSIDAVVPKLTEHERLAFKWAVSDIDQTTLHRRYPGGSVREIVRGEVGRVKAEYPTRLATLKGQVAAQAPVLAELRKLTAHDVDFSISEGFFGAKPSVRAVLRNGSTLPISRVKWRANLYLDGSATPAASSLVVSDFQSVGGVEPGTQREAVFSIGFVTGDASWTTLEVRNAGHRRVTLDAVAESAMDYGNRPYLERDDRGLIDS